MKQEEIESKLLKANLENRKVVVYPEYFKKKKKRFSSGFTKMLENTAKSDFTDADEFGVYKTGTFLFKNAVVTVGKEDGLWTLHMISDAPIGLPMIKEARYRFLPDACMMAQLFENREAAKELKGVLLYQIPNNQTEDDV